MSRRIVIILLFLLGLPSLLTAAQNALHYGFRQVGSDDGLSASYVKSIAQDSNGFMWFGTKNGLNRYDGVSVKTFNCHDKKSGKRNNNIGAIYENADGNLWIGTDRGVYILDPRTEIFTKFDVKSKGGVGIDDWVGTIAGDDKGNVWIMVPNQGVFRYGEGRLDYYGVTDHKGDKDKVPTCMAITSQGGVFVGTNRQGLFYYDPQNGNFRKLTSDRGDFDVLHMATASFMDVLPNGEVCLVTHEGHVFRINPQARSVNKINFSRDGNIFPYSLKCVDNEIWVGTSDGIFVLGTSDNSESEISRNTMGSRSLSDNTVTSIFMDRDHDVWAGTMFGGVNLVQRSGIIFERYQADASSRGLTSNRIRGMAVDEKGNIWIGTEESGVNMLDPFTGHVRKIDLTHPNTRITLCVKAIGDEVYAGFVRGGCMVYRNGQYSYSIGQELPQSGNDVYSVLKDRDGNFWLAASWGLYRKDIGSNEYRKVGDLGDCWILDMMEDSKGNIWFASMGDAIWRYSPSDRKYRHYPYDESHRNGLWSNSISSVYEDGKGRIWFSTDRGGLVMYNRNKDNFRSYGIEDGLPDDTSYSIVEDGSGNLWFGTNKGLVRFNPETKAVKVYSKGMSQFNYNSAVKAADGRFYFGGTNGVLTFNPETDMRSRREVPIFITDFRLSGAEEGRGGVRSLPVSILYSERIELAPDEGNFAVSIGSPDYTLTLSDEFQYRLLPVNKEWSTVRDPSNLSFAGLQPGSYTLEVKRAGAGEGMVKMLEIIIRSPWYSSWWAFCIYGLIIGAFVTFAAVYYRRKQLEKLAEKEGVFTIEKEKELYKKKMQFFTEIAHEIRTPLTLIGTPLEAIDEIGVTDDRIRRYLKVIRQNTLRLLDLTGQILDFQKMDSENPPLKFETVDINGLVKETLERFEMTMINRDRELSYSLPPERISASVDKDAVIKILSNLFNNAMKYSEKKIHVELTSSGDSFEVSVTSDGEKISGASRYRIFEPFYQDTKKADRGGVGIGLPLCKTLAYLHGGTIELLEDDEPDSNTFRLSLPLNLREEDSAPNPVMAEYVMEEESPMAGSNLGYSLLFVDDNDEMRDFLYEQLSQDFVVETACDGREALDKLKGNHFDIIVTDIMMPVMDGYELCRKIKENPDFSPIPVVFLTAKNDLESKVKALECGGEAYIEKPFSIKYFRQQIKSLLDNRRHERKAFLKKPFFTVDNMKLNKADEELMQKVVKIINENIDNESFNVESMADIFCMSRSSLLRKIKSLFGLSPVELIRVIRLKKAAELIQDGKYRMGDICYMVGINSQSYFTRLFFKQFGITPKAFEKQCREKQHSDSGFNLNDSNK